MVVSSYPLYSGVIGSGQRWSSSLSRPPTKKEHKDRQACVYVCMREKNPCEPVRTGAHQIPDARDVTMHDIAVLIFAALHFETFEVVQGARSFSCLGGSLWISERESTGDIISNGAP